MGRRRSKVALFNIEKSKWAARRRVWSGRSRLDGWQMRGVLPAYLNRSLGSLKLLLQGLVSGQKGAAPPLLLAQASLSRTHACTQVIFVTYAYMRQQKAFTQSSIYILSLSLSVTRSHTNTQWRTHSAGGGTGRQGACAGSAVSAFSGLAKYPCLDKASDMLRKASGITAVSISSRPSSTCHAAHPAPLNF